MQDVKLDQRDHKLLGILERDARTPVAELGRQLDLSRTAVRHRIEKLERHGVIQGYTLKAKPPQVSELQALATVSLSKGSVADLQAEIGHLLGVQTIWSVAGNVDAFVLMGASTIEALYQLINQVGAAEHVDKMNSHVVLEQMTP